MDKEKLLKSIMKLPKVETNNPIGAYGSINVDDLMSAFDRLNKVPTYDELLKENQELKKKVEERTKMYQNAYAYGQKMEGKTIILENHQKEFINYLKNKIKFYKINNQGYSMCKIEEILQKYKEIIGDDK